MPTRERVVLVIAAGLALATAAGALSLIVWSHIVGLSTGGWFAYSPDTNVAFADTGGGTATDAALVIGGIWLAAIAIWASVALRILRHPFDGSRRIGRQPEGA